MNYKLTIQYDGTEFCGWQTQASGRSVQGELEQALSLLEGRGVVLHGAGRTDAGVHAEGQVASVKMGREFSPESLRAAINGNVGRDVRVVGVEAVADEFHARYSARGKTYCYRVFNERVMSPFWLRYARHEARPLEVEAMRRAASVFLGRHDFTAFSSAQSDIKTRVRTLTRLDVEEIYCPRGRGRLIELRASADGFLRYMVRSLAGALLAAGRSETDAETIRHVLETRDRRLAPATTAPHGLTLIEVVY